MEELLQEIMGEYPTLGQVFVEERDIFLANSLKMAAMLSLADYLNCDEGTFRGILKIQISLGFKF